MPIITTSGLSNSVRVQYEAKYVEGVETMRLYDQLASPVGADMANLKRGSSITIPFISKLAPSSQTMSETDDLVPQDYTDATVTVTPTSRGNAVKWSEKVELITYTENAAARISNLGENMAESIDLLAQAAALTGSLTYLPAARSSLDAGTTTHRISRTAFITADAMLKNLRVPMFMTSRGGRRIAIFNPLLSPDLANDSNILAVGQYQQSDIVLNGEIGELWGWKLIADANAKVFYGAGAANGSAVATTLAADVKELATTITVASAANIAVGKRLMIGTVETANTHYATNESVIVAGINSTTITIIGQGENGGLRYAHASGVAVKNADNVVPVVFGGPESLGKVYDTDIGEYGQVVGPKKQGLADQFTTMAWKFYGGYGIVAQNRILRGEFSTSLDA